jgi:hypothetical protein
MTDKRITSMSMTLFPASEIPDHYTLYVHRGNGVENVQSYTISCEWDRSRKARRLLRFFRLCNAFAKIAMMSGGLR